jgi:hypothetical protein
VLAWEEAQAGYLLVGPAWGILGTGAATLAGAAVGGLAYKAYQYATSK